MKRKGVIYGGVWCVNEREESRREIEDLKRYGVLEDIEIVGIFEEEIRGGKKIEEREVVGECLE